MDYHKTVSRIFDYFHYKIYKNASFKLDLSVNNQKKQVDNFIKLLANHYQIPAVGTNFLIDYFCFTFHYWSDKVTKRKIALNWVIGKKIFQRWLERPDSYQYFYNKFLREYDINIDQLRQELHAEDIVIDNGLNATEELEKLRFEGEARLYNCLHHTTLYNHRSVNCLSCTMKGACKKIMQEQFPNRYKQRGYESVE